MTKQKITAKRIEKLYENTMKIANEFIDNLDDKISIEEVFCKDLIEEKFKALVTIVNLLDYTIVRIDAIIRESNIDRKEFTEIPYYTRELKESIKECLQLYNTLLMMKIGSDTFNEFIEKYDF